MLPGQQRAHHGSECHDQDQRTGNQQGPFHSTPPSGHIKLDFAVAAPTLLQIPLIPMASGLPARRDWIDVSVRLASSWVGLLTAYVVVRIQEQSCQ